jgi:hypothetical protein
MILIKDPTRVGPFKSKTIDRSTVPDDRRRLYPVSVSWRYRARGDTLEIYLKFTILKNYMHRAPTRRAREGRQDESTVNNSDSKLASHKIHPRWGIISFFDRWVVGPVNRHTRGEKLKTIMTKNYGTC